MALAESLGKFVWEIEEYMPPEEYALWCAELELRKKESDKQIQKAKRRSK